MAQLWGGRFTKQTDKLVYNFNASISFDQKFYKQDIEGSIAHVRMLGKPERSCIPGAAAMTRWRSICVSTPERNCSTWMRS